MVATGVNTTVESWEEMGFFLELAPEFHMRDKIAFPLGNMKYYTVLFM